MTEKILAIKELKDSHYDELQLNEANVINRGNRGFVINSTHPTSAIHFAPADPCPSNGAGMHVIAHHPHQVVGELLVDGKPTQEEVENSALPFAVVAKSGEGGEDGTTSAMKVMVAEMEKNKNIADLVEMKLMTEQMLSANHVLVQEQSQVREETVPQ
jgi:hypothetical protein